MGFVPLDSGRQAVVSVEIIYSGIMSFTLASHTHKHTEAHTHPPHTEIMETLA